MGGRSQGPDQKTMEDEHEKDEESTDDVQQPEDRSERTVDYVKGTVLYVRECSCLCARGTLCRNVSG